MTKSEFATRLLFWLLPWPISKSLPKALRIQYFGPSAVPVDPWPDLPPPPPDWIPTPGEPLPPNWPPIIPGPPDWNPDPGSPYIPGPGPVLPSPQPGQDICTLHCDNTYWTPYLGTWNSTQNIWEPEGDADGLPSVGLVELPTWVQGYRPVFLRVTCGGPATTFVLFIVDAVGHELASSLTYSSGALLLLSWLVNDIDYILIRTEPPVDWYLTNIEFL